MKTFKMFLFVLLCIIGIILVLTGVLLFGDVKTDRSLIIPVALFIILGCLSIFVSIRHFIRQDKADKETLSQRKAEVQEEKIESRPKTKKNQTATGSCDVAGMWYHRSEVNKVLTDGEYYGECELEPDDEYPDSVKIFVDDHLIGYVPKRSRKNVRILLPYITKSTVELQKTREDGETIYSGTLHMEFPAEVLDKDILEKE